jgi:hypothetical protein
VATLRKRVVAVRLPKGRAKALARLGVPEIWHTVIYGARTESFAFGRGRLEARLIEWHHAGMGLASYGPSNYSIFNRRVSHDARILTELSTLRPVSQANVWTGAPGTCADQLTPVCPAGGTALGPAGLTRNGIGNSWSRRRRSAAHRLPGPIPPTLQACRARAQGPPAARRLQAPPLCLECPLGRRSREPLESTRDLAVQ